MTVGLKIRKLMGCGATALLRPHNSSVARDISARTLMWYRRNVRSKLERAILNHKIKK